MFDTPAPIQQPIKQPTPIIIKKEEAIQPTEPPKPVQIADKEKKLVDISNLKLRDEQKQDSFSNLTGFGNPPIQ